MNNDINTKYFEDMGAIQELAIQIGIMSKNSLENNGRNIVLTARAIVNIASHYMMAKEK